jgi:hypothetical protein
MPQTHEGPHARLLGIIDAWREDARWFVESIKVSRVRGLLAGPEDRLTMFSLSTSEIIGWFMATRPQVDFQPIIRIYEVAQKWTADGNSQRLPKLSDIETQWDLSDILLLAAYLALAKSNWNEEPPSTARNGQGVPARVRDKAVDARDRWIYAECCKGIAYDTMARALTKKPASWPRIDSKQGIQNAAKRYAQRHNLAPIPKRQE